MSILDEVITECYGNKPETVANLLRVIAKASDARKNGHDTIFFNAADMIEAFARKTK
jgi:hypothetical protein